MGAGVVLGDFTDVVRRMQSVAVRDMRMVRGLLMIPFRMVFGSLAVVSRGVLVVFGSFVVLHGSILCPGELHGAAGIAVPRGNPMGF